jgi:hypothetical protein
MAKPQSWVEDTKRDKEAQKFFSSETEKTSLIPRHSSFHSRKDPEIDQGRNG